MNKLHTAEDIVAVLAANESFVSFLKLIDSQVQHPWCVFGGQLRNIVWDHIHENTHPTQSKDIDVAIFAPDSKLLELSLQNILYSHIPAYHWDIENFAYSHNDNNDTPYSTLDEGLSKQLMTIMSIGATLDSGGNIRLIAPLGAEDLLTCTIRPTPIIYEHPERISMIIDKIEAKHWKQQWPLLQINL
ncbi:MAG: hypothetical protein JWO54_967 [Candidatus Saccharibacteria bacterium]|nr:hypothetical protein [Candidatus Saccharibacteria bacterium]MDB5181204.1 hypothetical protein [Candidatus Saccharibacteria bacterium]